MKTATAILGTVVALLAVTSYAAYVHICIQIDNESLKRSHLEYSVLLALSKYMHILDTFEAEKDSENKIIELKHQLDLTLQRFKTYNASAKIKKPRRKYKMALGGQNVETETMVRKERTRKGKKSSKRAKNKCLGVPAKETSRESKGVLRWENVTEITEN